MTRPGTIHWTGAGILALGLHLGVLMVVFAMPRDGAVAPGLGGISVAVTMMAARAGSELDAREQQVLAPPEVTSPSPPPTEVQAVTPPPMETLTEPVAESIPVLDALPTVAPDLATVQAVSVETPNAEPPKPAKPLPTPPAKPTKPIQAKVPVTPPASATTPVPTKHKTATADRAQKPSRAAVASQGRRNDGRKGHSADERNTVGGGPVGTPAPNYVNQLRYWLERNKTYPKKARRHRMQGVVHLYFRVTREGRVLRHEIRKSSGHVLLDDETEAMLARAQPLPKFPSSMKGGYLDVVVPVQFSLRGNN